VWWFDRFARSVSHLLRVLEQFQALGIDFISLSENVDTSTPTGKMVFTVLGAVAELERSLIVDRVKAGLRNARAKGKKLGHPRVKVDESRVKALRDSGASWRAIARQLGLSLGTVRRTAQRSRELGSPLEPRHGLANRLFLECSTWNAATIRLAAKEQLTREG
jgi:DNA invertase Pin-like site-specific DNA recombinase